MIASQLVNTKSCDWVFEHVFNEQVLNSKSKTEQIGLLVSSLERLAESLAMMDMAQEGIFSPQSKLTIPGAQAELFGMAKEMIAQRKDLASSMKVRAT